MYVQMPIGMFNNFKMPLRVGTHSERGILILDDDTIVRILEEAMLLPADTMGLEYFKKVKHSCLAARAFAFSCKRFAHVLSVLAQAQHSELRARSRTKIMPARPSSSLAFTEQIGSETASLWQMRMLKASHAAMVCHCSSSCCLRIQKAFNRDLKRGKILKTPERNSVVVRVLASCSLLSPSEDGNVAFAYVRKRLTKIGVHGESRGKRYEHEIVQMALTRDAEATQKAQMALEDVDIGLSSPPWSMRSAPDGSSVAWVRSCVDQLEPNTCVCVWSPHVMHAVCSPSAPMPSTRVGRWNAQDAWFASSPDKSVGALLLVVAWSSTCVEPSGNHINFASCTHSYMFRTYSMNPGLSLQYQGQVHDGLLFTCSPTRAGHEVLVIVKDGGTGKRSTKLHDLLHDAVLHIPHRMCNSEKGPLCASISPMGDCIASMHITDDSLAVGIQVRTSCTCFMLMQRSDLSTWLGGAIPVASHQLKAFLALSFSPCGRFVVIQDRSPFFGSEVRAFGVVLLDTGPRLDTPNILKPSPMFETDDQAPRTLHWTRSGIWMMPPGTDINRNIGSRGGALCLFTPTAAVS